jgi:large subunit ribosomal protein L32
MKPEVGRQKLEGGIFGFADFCGWLFRRERISLMPNPKRRHSQRRTSTRRAHDALKGHTLSECPNCHEKKMPHRACPKCGYYKGREVLEVEEAS